MAAQDRIRLTGLPNGAPDGSPVSFRGKVLDMSNDSFGSRSTLEVGPRSYEIFRLDALQASFDVARLPYSLKVLLENLLRNEDGTTVTAKDIETLASWRHNDEPRDEIAFRVARVLLQDF